MTQWKIKHRAECLQYYRKYNKEHKDLIRQANKYDCPCCNKIFTNKYSHIHSTHHKLRETLMKKKTV